MSNKSQQFTFILSGRKSAYYFGYLKAEEQSHNLTKWFTLFVTLFYTFGTILFTLLQSFWNIYNQNFDPITWYLPYDMHVFFVDKSTFFGWYFDLLLQALIGYAFVFTMTSTVTFFGGCSFYLEACRLQLKHMFDDMIQKEEIDSAKQLKQTVIFHNTVFE